jgi:hypothetical protein
LLLNVGFQDVDWGSTTRGSEVRWRPQNAFPVALHKVTPFRSQQAAGNSFEGINQGRHSDLRRLLDEQVDVIGFAIHVDQSRFKVSAYLGEYSPKTGKGFAIEYAIAVFG